MRKLHHALLLITLALCAALGARAAEAGEKYTIVVVHGATATLIEESVKDQNKPVAEKPAAKADK